MALVKRQPRKVARPGRGKTSPKKVFVAEVDAIAKEMGIDLMKYESLCCYAEMEPEDGHCPSCGQNAEPSPVEPEPVNKSGAAFAIAAGYAMLFAFGVFAAMAFVFRQEVWANAERFWRQLI